MWGGGGGVMYILPFGVCLNIFFFSEVILNVLASKV